MVLVLCILSDLALYFVQSFMKISKRVSEVLSGHDFQQSIFQRGTNSVKHVGGVMVLVLCLLSDDALYLYKVS